ncbi:hypothetical protein NDU88_001259 [Pleurodeles waltl]|uniref:Uncharacterized protein n=1 Tax=Pleurodeles waltl TaxID=8319 RepID=A0AAV7NE84_PLEWA|nr:hypothetical protein NDU88_001259 [Pleurodeles waltl]
MRGPPEQSNSRCLVVCRSSPAFCAPGVLGARYRQESLRGRVAFTERSPTGCEIPWCAGPRGESSARRACAVLAAGPDSLRGRVAFKKAVPRRQCTQCLLRSPGYGLGSPSG